MDCVKALTALLAHFGLPLLTTSYTVGLIGLVVGFILLVYSIISFVNANGNGLITLMLAIYVLYSSGKLCYMAKKGTYKHHPIFQSECYKSSRPPTSGRLLNRDIFHVSPTSILAPPGHEGNNNTSNNRINGGNQTRRSSSPQRQQQQRRRSSSPQKQQQQRRRSSSPQKQHRASSPQRRASNNGRQNHDVEMGSPRRSPRNKKPSVSRSSPTGKPRRGSSGR